MDQDRQIRFLISPFFLYASLLWWAYLDPTVNSVLIRLKPNDLKDLLTVVAAAGSATIPIGLSIGTLGISLLKLWFKFRSRHGDRQLYDACVSNGCLQTMLREVGTAQEDRGSNRESLLYVAATFDHELLPEKIHEWLLRRWNSFNVAFNSALALFISILIIPIRILYTFSLDPICGWNYQRWWWLGTNIFLICVFAATACAAWHETMAMIEFQARRKGVYKLKYGKPH
jgi:hypothetical protein